MAKRMVVRPGVRCRLHKTRKHGVGFDRYWSIYYRYDGRNIEEGLGWTSEGWSEKKAAGILAELQENQRRGEGPVTLKEKRALAEAVRQEQELQKARAVMERLTFAELFETRYFPASKGSKRNPGSWRREASLFRLWIEPVIGKKTLKEIAPIHLENIKAKMGKAGLAPRSIHYALAVVRQVFNYARLHNLYEGENPVSKVKKPSLKGNQRLRFLTRDEAEALLAELAGRSRDAHDMALLSLHTGMRAGEIFNLAWGDVDMARGILTLRDTKSGRNRPAFMTEGVKAMLEDREKGVPTDLVFPARGGGKMVQVSDSFNRAVSKLGLNEGITDRRQRVVFHSLRHTFASWLAEQGTDLYTIKELMGHQDFKMTSRYSHLGPSTLQAAVKQLDKSLNTASEAEVIPLNIKP